MRSLFIALLLLALTACSSGIGRVSTPGLPSQPVQASLTLVSSETTPTKTATPPAAQVQLPETPTASAVTATTGVAATSAAPAASAKDFPDVGQVAWRTIVRGVDSPVAITNAGDGSGRMFVVEKSGLIRIIQDDLLLETPFLDIRDRVGSHSSEQGLLGLAFHPKYRENGLFFVNYTDKNGDTHIASFHVSGQDANLADPGSEKRLLYIPQPYANHNGGSVVFGPDGYLYLGLGDGGSAGDPKNNAQSLNTLLGKILRIDVDHGDAYGTPPANAFAAGQLPEIWAYGLRNPWRFSFDRQTGDLFIGDVGQDQWEEIDYLPAGSPAGSNFGWKFMEGNHPYSPEPPPADLVLTPPIAEYNHSAGCSVTGGVVYRGSLLPTWNGLYLFADFCSGNISGLLRDDQGSWKQKLLFENLGQISSFGEDEQGEVYVLNYAGQIYRLESKQ
jgi:glucose/arabinose dehydrogenase